MFQTAKASWPFACLAVGLLVLSTLGPVHAAGGPLDQPNNDKSLSNLADTVRSTQAETGSERSTDLSGESVATTAAAAASLKLTGDGSRRHLQGYAWAQESRWPHGTKDKASISHLDHDYFDVQGPFPAPAAAPASGVDASAAAAPTLSGDGSKRRLLGLVKAAASSWGNEDKDKPDMQDNASETTAASS